MKNIKNYILTFLLILSVIYIGVAPITAEAATTTPAKVTINSATRSPKKKQITVKWKSIKKATGYQIAYKKETAKKYTIKTVKKTSKTISASNEATYKIKVRAYRKVNGKMYYGKWSSVKTVMEHFHDWTYKNSYYYCTSCGEKVYEQQFVPGTVVDCDDFISFGNVFKTGTAIPAIDVEYKIQKVGTASDGISINGFQNGYYVKVRITNNNKIMNRNIPGKVLNRTFQYQKTSDAKEAVAMTHKMYRNNKLVNMADSYVLKPGESVDMIAYISDVNSGYITLQTCDGIIFVYKIKSK